MPRRPLKALSAGMESWHQGKLFVEHALTVSHDALHLLVGLIAWLLLGLTLRQPLTAWLPWAGVLVLISWNEAVDLWVERWPDPGQQFGEGLKDMVFTMAAPSILMVAARLWPRLFIQSGEARRR